MFKRAVALRKKKDRRDDDLFLIEGTRIIEDALQANARLEYIFWDDRIERTVAGRHLLQRLAEQNVNLEKLRPGALDRLCDTVSPAGIVALAGKPIWKPPGFWPPGDLLIFESISDPGNLGTVIRTAEAGGIAGILLTGDSVEIFNPKVVRATMGSIFRVPVAEITELSEVERICREKGLPVTGLSAKACNNLFEMDPKGFSAFVFGGEHHGVPKATVSLCENMVKIPMSGNVESLNLAVSAALVVFYRRISRSPSC